MKKVAILIDEGYEDSEFIYPYYRFIEASIEVDILAGDAKIYKGKRGTTIKAAQSIHGFDKNTYDAVYIPGGHSPEHLRKNPEMLAFVRMMFEEKNLICAVCHGPLLLVSAGILRGKKATGFPSIKEDIETSGAIYTAKSVECDENIITAQDPSSMPEMMRLFLTILEK